RSRKRSLFIVSIVAPAQRATDEHRRYSMRWQSQRRSPTPRNSPMKLFYSPLSPYVRKCLVAARELGLHERIELVPAAAHPVNRDRNIVAHNPLGKVPTLVTDEGAVLYDSRVICEYLNAVGKGNLIPQPGP